MKYEQYTRVNSAARFMTVTHVLDVTKFLDPPKAATTPSFLHPLHEYQIQYSRHHMYESSILLKPFED